MAFADGQELGMAPTGEGVLALRLRARRRHLLLGAALCLVAVAAALGLRWYRDAAHYISTDDAYVGASLAEITPQVDGTVGQLLVTDTAHVRRGDLLVVLDRDDADLTVQQARAAYQQAVQHVEQYLANAGEASADVMGKTALARRAEQALERRKRAGGAVSAEELSNAQSAYDEARYQLSMAQQRLVSERALARDAKIETNPEVLAAKAALDAALLGLKRTEIRAPVDGVVAQLRAQVGQRVRLGTPLMSIVPIMDAHVDANFKEGQIERIRAGQPVTLTSDLYGADVVFHGRIAGIGGGTGAALSVIPAQNATGNWIKVVQRLPVRIALDPAELEGHPLRVGLSMNVKVDLEGDAGTPPPIRTAAADNDRAPFVVAAVPAIRSARLDGDAVFAPVPATRKAESSDRPAPPIRSEDSAAPY
jgi:membrane fusion protein (multidrug efflux system)